MSLSGINGREELKRNIYAAGRIKADNESFLYIVDAVNEAITRKRKISFQYTDYTPEKKKILKNDHIVQSGKTSHREVFLLKEEGKAEGFLQKKRLLLRRKRWKRF